MLNRIVYLLTGTIFAVIGLTWVSSGELTLGVWGSFSSIILVSFGIIFGSWWIVKPESPPRWIGWLLVCAILLRLGAAILWYIALPEWGHGTDGEMAGYIMSDAYVRDTQAWELGRSDKSLLSAFQDYRFEDQYGGRLFFSSTVYRLFGGNTHYPLLISVITSAFSGLSILFVWAFTRRLWGDFAAKIASWMICFYPEAILLGSSQMREAFMMTLAAVALYGLQLYWEDRNRLGLALMVGALGISLPLSYLFSVMLLGVLIWIVVTIDHERNGRNWVIWGGLGVFMLAVIAGFWFFGERIYPEGADNPLELIQQWLVFAARWEERTAAISSGWLEKIFKRSPEWMNIWIILGYGTFQPFLPAALIATGNQTWQLIAIWRSLGWTFLLGLLLYAPFRAGWRIKKNRIAANISLLVWTLILISAYRGGGDQWDNPRYRVTFIVLQVALASWVWTEQRKNYDPWFRRVIVGLGWVFAWFIPWYLRRYLPNFTWSVIDLFKTLGLGVVSAMLYWIWDWVRCQEINQPPRL